MIIGIDNGVSGGITAIQDDGKFFKAIKMPVKNGMIDILGVVNFIENIVWLKTETIVIEACPEHSRDKRAMKSMATSFGILYGGISAAFPKINIHVVRSGNPRDSWQRFMLGRVPAGQTKATALKRAKQIWPDQSFLAGPKCRVAHSGIVDAALIAYHYIENLRTRH